MNWQEQFAKQATLLQDAVVSSHGRMVGKSVALAGQISAGACREYVLKVFHWEWAFGFESKGRC